MWHIHIFICFMLLIITSSAWRGPFSISRKVGMVAKKRHFWRAVLLGQLFLIGSFFLSALHIHGFILSWSVRAVLRNLFISWNFLSVYLSIGFFSFLSVFSSSKISFGSFFCFLSFCWTSHFIFSVIFLILLNYISVFFYSSLSIFRTISLNCLLGSSCISITLGFVTDGLLCSFDGVMIPWFFMVPCSLSFFFFYVIVLLPFYC